VDREIAALRRVPGQQHSWLDRIVQQHDGSRAAKLDSRIPLRIRSNDDDEVDR
jgi:hypothetical protein